MREVLFLFAVFGLSFLVILGFVVGCYLKKRDPQQKGSRYQSHKSLYYRTNERRSKATSKNPQAKNAPMSGQWTATKTWTNARPWYEKTHPEADPRKDTRNHTMQKSAVYELQFLPDGRIVGTGKNEVEVDVKLGGRECTIGTDFEVEGKYNVKNSFSGKTETMWQEKTQTHFAKRNDDDDGDREKSVTLFAEVRVELEAGAKDQTMKGQLFTDGTCDFAGAIITLHLKSSEEDMEKPVSDMEKPVSDKGKPAYDVKVSPADASRPAEK